MTKFIKNPIYMATTGAVVGMLSREIGAVFFEVLHGVFFSLAVVAELLGGL